MHTDKQGFNPEDIILKDGKKVILKHEDITHVVLKSAFEVINTLGAGFLEKVYETALLHELNQQGILVESQKKYNIHYKEIVAGEYISDIVVENKVIVEIKVADKIVTSHESQLLNYLHASGLEVGLIINFAHNKLEYKRLVY